MQPTTIDPRLKFWFNSLHPNARQQFLAETAGKLQDLHRKQNSKYRQFQRTYYDNWVAFIHDCIDWREGEAPTAYQNEFIAELQARGRAAERGPHGLGKTSAAAWILLAFTLTRDGNDWKAPPTASAWRQLTHYLWPEVRKWARRLRWAQIGREPFSQRTELMTLSLRLETGEAFAASSDDPSTLEGAHADHILYIFDEAKSIPDEIFDAAEGAFSGPGEVFALAISTPGEPLGRFYDIHKRKPGYEDWWVRHVTLDEAIRAGRISREWAQQRKRQWGKKSAVYQNRVLGEFAASDEDSVIPLSWIELANERWYQWQAQGKPGRFWVVGADIGGGSASGDDTVLASIYEPYNVDELDVYPTGDIDTATMETTGRIKGILDTKGGTAVIDNVGIGLGVYHRLREQGHQNALAFSAGKGTKRRDKTGEFGFADVRSAAWWFTRELLDPESGEDVALPPDDQLTGELTAPSYRIQSGAKIKVESKVDIRKRLKRSTDRADGTIQGLVGLELCDEDTEGVFVW